MQFGFMLSIIQKVREACMLAPECGTYQASVVVVDFW